MDTQNKTDTPSNDNEKSPTLLVVIVLFLMGVVASHNVLNILATCENINGFSSLIDAILFFVSICVLTLSVATILTLFINSLNKNLK